MATIKRLTRFSGRASVYARYRPGYPDAVIKLLAKRARWTPEAVVADIGAGTGISSELFLRHGGTVYAVEPNADMRAEAAGLAARYPRFQLFDGTAEATGLADGSVDLVVAATAFHWFDALRCREEFERILQPKGLVVLMWNLHASPETPFVRAFEQLAAKFGDRFRHVWGRERHNIGNATAKLFGEGRYARQYFEHEEQLNYEALEGRLLSASYVPRPGDGRFEEMLVELGEVFAQFAIDGRVEMKYQTVVYYGSL